MEACREIRVGETYQLRFIESTLNIVPIRHVFLR